MKNKNIAGILALLLGIFGVHRFYLNQRALGIIYLCFFWTGIPALIGFIDGIVLLAMGEEEFDDKYNRFVPDYRRHDTDFDRRTNRYQNRDDARRERADRRYQEREERLRRRSARRNSTLPTNSSLRKKSAPKSRFNPFHKTGMEKYRDYDYLGAIEDFRKALEIAPRDVAVHFNLACAYSLLEEKEAAFDHLSKAVEYGFVDFKKIQTHDALAYLRIQDEFDEFRDNNYLLPKEEEPAAEEEQEEEMLPLFDSEEKPQIEEDFLNKNSLLLDQIKRLGELREKGLLTTDEFEAQKRKLLG